MHLPFLAPGQLILTIRLLVDGMEDDPLHLAFDPNSITIEDLDIIIHNISNMAWQLAPEDREEAQRFIILFNDIGEQSMKWDAPSNAKGENDIVDYIWDIIGE